MVREGDTIFYVPNQVHLRSFEQLIGHYTALLWVYYFREIHLFGLPYQDREPTEQIMKEKFLFWEKYCS